MNALCRAILILLLAAPGLVSAQSANTVYESPILRPGDLLRISVWRLPHYSGEFLIGPNGYIADPFYQGIRGAGIPLDSLAAQVKRHVGRYEHNAQVLVEPLLRIAVGGEVRRPDVYSLPPGTTLIQAIMMAGGPTDRARVSRVRLLRHRNEMNFDLRQAGSEMAAISLESGDQVLIERQQNVFRDYIGPTASVLSLVLAALRLARV
jgi:protein involved in polysaccharide export with SLBB domain